MAKENTIARIQSGIPGLDKKIEGGFVKNSTVMIRGDTGTAKTLFCIQYLYHGAKVLDDPSVYLSFSESRDAIHQHGGKFGWDFQSLTKKNKFAIIRYEPHEVVRIMEEGGGLIRDTLESIGAKRLVIDSLSAYEMFFDSKYKANQSILELFDMLKKWEVTTLVTSEFPASLTTQIYERLGFLTDGIINLYYIRRKYQRLRALEIIKMRDTLHDNRVSLFSISRAGLKVDEGSGQLARD